MKIFNKMQFISFLLTPLLAVMMIAPTVVKAAQPTVNLGKTTIDGSAGGYVDTSTLSDPLAAATVTKSFTPGAVMLDTKGNAIDAHGAGVMYDKTNKTYYLYGEYHSGAWPSAGVRCYSSTDLYNWTDEGMALTMIASKDQFTTDPLISKLYAGRTDTDNIWADIRIGRIIERPKVIYNDMTKKYVMWMHTDGDKDPSNNAQDYGKAQAGCALSDSPAGPFVYQAGFRMDQCPTDQKDYQPGNPGMARDMNLFKDDNGTAYLIYSSEENMTIYVSKLTADYTDVTGWHKDGNVDPNGKAVRDSTYKGVYGVDYTRINPGAQREAPAMFKYDGKYYLLTSGATGWAPNENKYTVAYNIMGPWSPMVDPFVKTLPTDPNPLTAFGTQTTDVIPVDPANGKFIYMGDIWNGGDFSNNGAKYVWLPIDFGQGTDMTIKWYDNWDLNALDNAAKVDIITKLPEAIATGTTLPLPSQLKLMLKGAITSTAVTWSLNSQTIITAPFSQPGLYTLQATLPQYNNKALSFKIYAIPDKTLYFVNSSGYKTSDYSLMTSYMQDTLANKSVVDQAYNETDSAPWGYVGTNTNISGSIGGDIFSTLRYLNSGNVINSPAGTDLTYKFTVKNGSYTVYTGFNDIWSNSSRTADLYINGVKTNAITYISNTVYGNTVDVTNGNIDITVRKTTAQDPLINWVMVVDNSLTHDSSMGLNVVSTTSNSATLAWNKVLGATSYTLYRSDSADGTYTPLYNGNSVICTSSGMESAKKYYYKVSSTSGSGESSLSNDLTVLIQPIVDKTELPIAISNAKTLLASKTVGIEVGNIPQIAVDTFQSVLTTAAAINMNTAATQVEVDAQIAAIFSATMNFNNAVIKKPAVNVDRLSGLNRIETAIAIARNQYTDKNPDAVVLATANDFPDALAGSGLAYKYNAPLLLVNKTVRNSKTVLDYITTNLSKNKNIYILGETGAVSKEISDYLTSQGYKIIRLGGKNRFETNQKIINYLNIVKGTPIVIASGNDFADALSISSMADIKGYPILLNGKDSLSANVSNYITNIEPTTVYVIGEAGVLSTNIETQIKKLNGNIKIVRIGGVDRYETSLKIADYFNLTTNTITMASGLNYPDALCGSVLAARKNSNVLLVDNKNVTSQILFIDKYKISNVIIFGGEGVISSDTVNSLIQK